MKISAIILLGEKVDDNLYKKCLDSILWVDEIVNVDTTKLSVGNFADWRDHGARKARGDWLLYIDSDEEVSPKLKSEILGVVNDPKSPISAFAIPRVNTLLGRCMHYGGWSPDYVVRLIKKEKLEGWRGRLHEQPEIKGEVGKLKNPLEHVTHRSISEMIAKTNDWSGIEAELLFEAGHPQMSVLRFLTAAFREFWYRGIRKLGFLDGYVGIIEIVYQTFSRLVTYTKLWELQSSNGQLKGRK